MKSKISYWLAVATLAIVAILASSCNAYGQEVKLSKWIKGNWESRTECIIARDTTILLPNVTKAWILENYGFDSEFKNFLWIKKYNSHSTNQTKTYFLSKGKYSIENLNNTGAVGEVIGRVKIVEHQLKIDPSCKCDVLKDVGNVITYDVIRYKRYDDVDHMIWSPTDSTLSYNDKYEQSIFWYRK